jgi:hypothetical protein
MQSKLVFITSDMPSLWLIVVGYVADSYPITTFSSSIGSQALAQSQTAVLKLYKNSAFRKPNLGFTDLLRLEASLLYPRQYRTWPTQVNHAHAREIQAHLNGFEPLRPNVAPSNSLLHILEYDRPRPSSHKHPDYRQADTKRETLSTYTYLRPGKAFSYSLLSFFNVACSNSLVSSELPPLAFSMAACSALLKALSTFFSPNLGCELRMSSRLSRSLRLPDVSRHCNSVPTAVISES